ncbi:tandem-95 repeat protein [Candidatus Woesearchaeota archaeon]|nr:tandem-95 repeat protein [Candidatus Woesearchaeota archaeon]
MIAEKRWILYAMLLVIVAPFVIAATFTFSPPIHGTVFYLTQGVSWSYDVNVSIDESNVSYAIQNNTFSSLTINEDTGVLNFTPNNDDVIIWYKAVTIIAINVSDKTGFDREVATIGFNITNINDPPNITSVSPYNESDPDNFTTEIDELEPLYMNITVIDVDMLTYEGDTLNYTWYIDGVINETVLNSTSLNATYIPDYLSAGPNASMVHNITVKVTDSHGASDNYTWRVNVTDMNRPPWLDQNITPDYFNWTEDTNLTDVFNLDDYFKDNDTDNYPLTYIANYAGSDMQVNITETGAWNHTVSFYPDQDFFGVIILTFNASDYMNSTESNNVTLNVTPVNDAPYIYPVPNQTAFVGAPFLLKIDAYDVDDTALNYYNNHTGLFNISASGLINFTPTAGQVGNYTVRIWVDDNKVNSTISFNLEIMANNIPILRPYPIPDEIVPEKSLYSLYVNATDLDNDSMTFYSNFSYFSVNQVNVNSSFAYATFSFTPSQIHVGLNTIRIYVNDSHGAVNSSTYLLNITDQNDPPVLGPIPDPIITRVNKTYTIRINASDTDLDIETFYENSTYFNITDITGAGTGYATGLINFTPDHTGWEYVRISVNDSLRFNDEVIVLVNVTDNHAPYFTNVPGMMNCSEDSLCEYDIDADDFDNDDLYYYSNASIFTINETTGLISFTPGWELVGLYSIYLNVTDGELWNSTNFTLNISAVNDTPYFDPPIDSYPEWDSVYEGFNFFLVLNATDEENDTLNFSNVFINETNLFNISIYNLTLRQALINFTPNITQVGNHTVNISVTDGNSTNTTTLRFEVLFYNDPPEILWWNATNGTYWTNETNLTILETDTWTFIINATDPDLPYNDSLSYNWTMDRKSKQINGTEYDYYPGYFAQGNHTLNVTITDRWGENTSFWWHIEVLNVNRAPVFGKKEYLSEGSFQNGTFINLTFQSGRMKLADPPPPYLSGLYTSEIIDMVEDDGNFRFSIMDLGSSEPNGTNITFQTRSSQYETTDFTDWSDPGNATSNAIDSPSYQFFQYRLLFRSNESGESPSLANATVNYVISNLTRDEDVIVDPWIDLDDFFYDADGNTELHYNVSGAVHLEILINTSNNKVSIFPEADWSGVETVYFTASDGNATAWSNNITIIYNPVEDETQTQTETITRTVTRTSLKREEVRVFTPIKILYPGNITMYKNNTFMTPIYIKNNGNQTFRGVNLTFEAENPDIKAYFSEPYFDEIGVNEQEYTEMYIESYKIFGTYEIIIRANVTSPAFSDSAKIYINSLEKAEGNRTAVNTKVAFTRDLLQRNPKCLELNEVLERAEEQIDLGNYEEADKMLEQVRTVCNYLLEPPEKEVQNPRILNAIGNSLLFMFGFMLVGLTSIAGYFIYRRYGGRKK